MWITGLDGLGEGVIMAEDMKVYYLDALALFLIGTITAVKNTGRTTTFGRLNNGGIGL